MRAQDPDGQFDGRRLDSQTNMPGRTAGRQDLFWIHQSSFLFRQDKPERAIETVWVANPGWGYLKRRDLWLPIECTVEELRSRGFVERKPACDGEVSFCPHCGMYIHGIPGYLVHKHTAHCRGSGEDWLKIEEAMITEKRISYYERLITERLEREKVDQEAQEKRERFEKIREEQVARQQQRDRKKRLKEETKQEWKQRWRDK